MKRRQKQHMAVIGDLAKHPEEFIPLQSLALRWNVEVQTVRKWGREGVLPMHRFGSVCRVRRDDAAAFEAKGRLRAAS